MQSHTPAATPRSARRRARRAEPLIDGLDMVHTDTSEGEGAPPNGSAPVPSTRTPSRKRHWHYWAIVDDGRGRVATKSKAFASRTACYAAMHRETRDRELHLGCKPCSRGCRLTGREYAR